jgi:predicted TIM-barrel fold metal-dependent hydrolase
MAVVLDRILDVDSHEMIPAGLWHSSFGDAGGLLEPLMEQPGNMLVAFVTHGDLPESTDLSPDNLWTMKGPSAPGAVDVHRRLQAMDAMGIERQLMFPTFGILGMCLAIADIDFVEMVWNVKIPSGWDMRHVGRAMAAGHNDWVMRMADEISAERIRPVAVIVTDDLDAMMAETERVLAGGARALYIPSSVPPGGRSPADRALDPFWTLVADADVPVTLHIGGEFGFMKSLVWGAIPEFAPMGDQASLEFPGMDPYYGSTYHYAHENFLAAMIMGGVFERHPTLRFGVIEGGAIWAGPLAERMDKWCEVFHARAAKTMDMRPSEYLARNVRVTPFFFEDIDRYLERWPNLVDIYCYSTDYPHPEGGKNTKQQSYEKLRRLGDDVIDRYFVGNAELLLPA